MAVSEIDKTQADVTYIPNVLSDYYAALLRTHHAFVAPTQGKLLNYVQRVPLGVVAQITVCTFTDSILINM